MNIKIDANYDRIGRRVNVRNFTGEGGTAKSRY